MSRHSQPLTECPNCPSIWSIGTDEYEFQKCSSCGWPDTELAEQNEEWDREFDDDKYD